MDIFDQIKSRAEEDERVKAAQDKQVQAANDERKRAYLRDRINLDFATYDNDAFWDDLAPDDPGAGAIKMLYKGAISWTIDGHPLTNTLTVRVSGRKFDRRGNTEETFWLMVAGALDAAYADYQNNLIQQVKGFWRNTKIETWGIATVTGARIDLADARKMLAGVEGKINGKEYARMAAHFAKAEAKVAQIAIDCEEWRHKKAVKEERERRAKERADMWAGVCLERLKIAYFYPFEYYQIYYGTGEDDYIESLAADPFDGDWYDDLNASGGVTQIPNKVLARRIMVTSLGQCEYLSWCRWRSEAGRFYSSPAVERGFKRLPATSHGDCMTVGVMAETGYLYTGGEPEPVGFIPLVPGSTHAPFTLLEQWENEAGIMALCDEWCDEHGRFRPLSLPEWLGVLANVADLHDAAIPFAELAGLPISAVELPPEIEPWGRD